jgi:hypothetical protein
MPGVSRDGSSRQQRAAPAYLHLIRSRVEDRLDDVRRQQRQRQASAPATISAARGRASGRLPRTLEAPARYSKAAGKVHELKLVCYPARSRRCISRSRALCYVQDLFAALVAPRSSQYTVGERRIGLIRGGRLCTDQSRTSGGHCLATAGALWAVRTLLATGWAAVGSSGHTIAMLLDTPGHPVGRGTFRDRRGWAIGSCAPA